MGIPLGGLFSELFGGPSQPPLNASWANMLQDWLHGKRGNWAPGSGANKVEGGLDQLFNEVNAAESKGTPFYESLIPSSPGALSPAAAAEKSAATDALQSSLGSAGVSQLGQLNREYGGRLPASMVQSGFGNLARAGAQGKTDIARNAILENVNLGEQGVQGLAGLSSLATLPLSTASGMVLPAGSAGLYNSPGAINQVVNTAKNVAGGVAGGLAGFGGLGGGGGASFGLPGQSSSNIQALPNTLSSGGFNSLMSLQPQTRQYLPTGGMGGF